jgi:heme-degrading monooxygenase HmoA
VSGKRMTRIDPDPGAGTWLGPVLVRGWLRVRPPWRHPFAAMTLLRKWRRLKHDVDRGNGFLSFEYWQRLDQMVFGMHVGWRSNAELQEFYPIASHRDIAKYATKSSLVCAMKLETFAVDSDGRLNRLGGFYICERESDLPSDSLFPVRAANGVRR